MKCFVALFSLMAVAAANPGAPTLAAYSYANPAGVTFRGTGFSPGFAIGPAQPVAQLAAAPAPVQYAQAAPAYQYAQAAPALQYARAAPAPAYQYAAAPAVQYHHAPAVAVTQKVGYTNTQVPVSVPGVADVPVTKLAYTQGVKQQLVDVATPAVTNRRVKVRRPALRKEFYDIEHRVIVRPAGSATLELSQPISKVQKGPAVLTPTTYQQLAPVVRYGNSRQIIDGAGVSSAAQIRVNLARGIENAGPAPAPQPQQQGPQDFQRAAPQPQPQQPQGPPPQAQQQPQQPQQPQAGPYNAGPAPQQQQQEQQQQQPQGPAPGPQLAPLRLRPQPQQQRPQQQQGPQGRSIDADVIEAGPQGPQGPPQQAAPQPRPPQGARLDIPQMPVELQARLLELLSAKGGTVTEVLGQDGQPADSASVLQVADALQDVNLQGGERITTRRIVVTRPIETEQEVDIQEPATKIHQKVVETPALFKTAIQGVQRVPVSLPGVKNVATPVLQTTYAHAAPAYAGYAHY